MDRDQKDGKIEEELKKQCDEKKKKGISCQYEYIGYYDKFMK